MIDRTEILELAQQLSLRRDVVEKDYVLSALVPATSSRFLRFAGKKLEPPQAGQPPPAERFSVASQAGVQGAGEGG